MENSNQEEVIEITEDNISMEEGRCDKVDRSHRVIEKRRRDRINNSLLQLSKLVPVEKFKKKSSGKLEKAEILEVTVQYIIQQQQFIERRKENDIEQKKENDNLLPANTKGSDESSSYLTAFLHGFKECTADATKFFQEVEELDVSEGRCHRLIQHLKKQSQHYQSSGKKPFPKGNATPVDRVWEGGDATKNNTANSVPDKHSNVQPAAQTENAKRKNDDSLPSNTKKQKIEASPTEVQSSPNQDRPPPSNNNSNTESSNDARNFMPYNMFPNVPFFPTFPFNGGNGMQRYQTPQAQFPGYGFPQSPSPYFPVPLPQFPFMGMNFMSGYGMMNQGNSNEQQQNNGMAMGANGLPCNIRRSGIPNGMTNGVPNGVVNGMMNNFLPSMYSNGVHANLLAMRPRDSGYESSDRSSSKESRSENSSLSFSDDSCRSFAT